jgi:hypothetical protein
MLLTLGSFVEFLRSYFTGWAELIQIVDDRSFSVVDFSNSSAFKADGGVAPIMLGIPERL